MRKLLLTTCLFMGLALAPNAAYAAGGQTITINGQTVEKTATELTFDGDNVVLHFSDGSQQSADMESVSIVFDNTAAGINQIHAFNLKGITDGNLNISGILPGQKVEIFDVSGKKVAETKASADNAQVDITNVKSGVYVLRAGNNIVKFIKR